MKSAGVWYAEAQSDPGETSDLEKWISRIQEDAMAEPIAMLADWVARIQEVGSGWDDWDEAYKDAAYRPCGIRPLLDVAIEKAKQAYKK